MKTTELYIVLTGWDVAPEKIYPTREEAKEVGDDMRLEWKANIMARSGVQDLDDETLNATLRLTDTYNRYDVLTLYDWVYAMTYRTQLEGLNDFLISVATMEKISMHKKLQTLKGFINKAENLVKEENGEQVPLQIQKKVKMSIRMYFEGFDGMDGVDPLPLIKLGVTNFKFRYYGGKLIIRVTLERPGLLIGKAGRTIDGLQNHLSKVFKKEVEIEIREAKVWY